MATAASVRPALAAHKLGAIVCQLFLEKGQAALAERNPLAAYLGLVLAGLDNQAQQQQFRPRFGNGAAAPAGAGGEVDRRHAGGR